MNFKEYDEIIKKHKYDMLFLEIYYNLTCNCESGFKKLSDDEKETLIYFIHRTYSKDKGHIDLCYICDKALKNKKEILKNDVNVFNTWNLLEVCYE